MNGSEKMEVYKRETGEILRRYQNGRLNLPDCIAALDAALGGLIAFVKPDQMEPLRAILRVNHETLTNELDKRRRQPCVHAVSAN
jgi:hypothetical protein